MLGQIAISVALAFVYGGSDAQMAHHLDDVGLGTIAPEGSVGILVSAHDGVTVHGGLQPLSSLALNPKSDEQWMHHDGPDPDGALDIALAELDRSGQSERVVIASDLDPQAVERFRPRAQADGVRVVVGAPAMARGVLDPQPIRVRCPSVHAPAFALHHRHHHHHRHGLERLLACLGLLGLAAFLARRAV